MHAVTGGIFRAVSGIVAKGVNMIRSVAFIAVTLVAFRARAQSTDDYGMFTTGNPGDSRANQREEPGPREEREEPDEPRREPSRYDNDRAGDDAGGDFLGLLLRGMAAAREQRPPVEDPRDRLDRAFVARLTANRDFQRWSLALNLQMMAQGYGPKRREEESQNETAAAVSRGMRRLDNAALVVRLRALSETLESIDTDTECSRVASKDDPAADMRAHLSYASLNDWYQLRYQALLAELAQRPSAAAQLSAQDRAEILKAVLASLPRDSRKRFLAASSDLNAASDKDVCWVTRSMLRQALKLPPRLRNSAARLFLQ